MSATKDIPLDFSMSFEELSSTCVEKKAFLYRDQAELAARGLTTAMIDAMETARVAFVALPTNVTEVANSNVGFKARDKQAAILLSGINVVMNIAKDSYELKSAEFKSFNVKGLSKMNANQLMNICPNIVTKGTAYIAVMGPKGLTTAMLTNITTQAATLLPLVGATPILVGDADAATVVRRNAANALFAMLKALCRTGHVFYLAAGNNTKAKEYNINDTASTVVDREGTLKTKQTKIRKAAGIVGTTRMRIKVKTGTSAVVYFGMTKTSPPPTPATTVLYNPNIFLDTTAAALGYDLAGGIIKLLIYNPNTDETDFLVKIGG